ncbi:MAG: glucose 1-dehydrogenase [Microbacterium sp.]|uniref:SDR family NAD(P)-dependent oxidoreductase n=2 Tax=Bacteria TaxID=2 RepID=UPI001AC6A302|nr:glucose 1-dehydrogenase [Microbacterium sp.]MBN9154800.1 glucose 1-dehydrogenase [Microbacterium sp.]
MGTDKRVAIVTGAGRGIGEAIARRLAADGLHVVAVDIDPETAGRTRDAVIADGGAADALALDVADRSAVVEAIDAVAERLGRIDAVVNNAMWIRYGALEEMDEATVDRMLAVGLKAVVWMAQASLPHLRRTSGCIVNVSSPAAVRATAGAAIYSAVKGAVSSLTWQMSNELGAQGVRVNAVVPGAVPTEGARALVDDAGYELRRAHTPLGRLGTPEDLAGAVSFLVSEDAAFVNGHLLAVDGGLLVS